MATPATSSRIPFTASQLKILGTLAAVVGLRMLGLFLVLPVFTLYGLKFTSSRFLVGFAFGSYGLTMGLFQIPFGRLSDRIGRRKVLLLGMSIFSLGSFLCAVPAWFPPPVRIGELIVGRLVQGVGAIVSVAFAAVADHVERERRSVAMAVLGIPIGVSFFIGVIAGPILAGRFNTELLFWLTGVLGLGTVWLIMRYLPEVAPHASTPAPLGEVLRHGGLMGLNLGGFVMNFMMASFFFYFPLIVTGQHHVSITHYYIVLLPMMLISGFTMIGFSLGADHGWARPLAAMAFLVFLPSAWMLFRPAASGLDPTRLLAVLIPGTLFYVGFTGLEPILPSLVSKTAPESALGTALGFFNTGQFLGSFVGGSVAGGLAHLPSVYIMATWIILSLGGALSVLAVRPERSPRT